MSLGPLIGVERLARHLDDPGWAVLDCRFRLDAPGAGRIDCERGHIPGAVYAHLEEDLSGPVTRGSGRHPLPAPATLARRMERLGVGDRTRVVCYDEVTGPFAARAWWLLRWLGHVDAAVLDGGIRAWQAAGYRLDDGIPSPLPGQLSASPRTAMTVTAGEIEARAGNPGWLLLDARSPERFRGEREPIDPVAGHIPGARNRPWTDNLDGRGFLQPADRLADALAHTLGRAAPGQVVSYCGSGVTACHNLLAMSVAGLEGGRLYPGSWSEWVRDPGRPVATGGE
ncbi:MAG TPA: sulfurtransferase [Gammaproteobacteria bacterium]|nr:sulfurtransferase [Gammaproteobacteria bacterium]